MYFQGEKIWVTRETDTKHLFEFSNKSSFRKDQPTKTYMLEYDYVVSEEIFFIISGDSVVVLATNLPVS